MLKVGLTGGIGSGKTTVAAIFGTLGIPVSYADAEAKRLMNEDPELRAAIITHFGPEIYAGGKLNRKGLAAKVFNDPEKLELLNSLVHPVTIREGERWMQTLAVSHPYAIREAALIFETRVRDHTTREDILRRMGNQIDEELKMALCDAVINNDEEHAVIPQVLALHRQLLTSPKPRSGFPT
jgi:dephospho-CoA kinase